MIQKTVLKKKNLPESTKGIRGNNTEVQSH